MIPIFNGSHFLPATLESITAQTYTNWEAIVIDDGSTEDIAAVCAQYSHQNIRLLRQEHLGTSAARNYGIQNSTGELVAFLDADDIWYPTKLAEQVPLLQDNKVGLCHTNFQLINADGTILGKNWYTEIHKTYRTLLTGNTICASTVLVSKEALAAAGEFDPFLPPCEDYDLWLKISQRFELAYIETIEASYRVHSQGVSKNSARLFASEREIYRRHIAHGKLLQDQSIVKAAKAGLRQRQQAYAYNTVQSARQQLKQGKPIATIVSLFDATTKAPFVATGALTEWVRGGLSRRIAGSVDPNRQI